MKTKLCGAIALAGLLALTLQAVEPPSMTAGQMNGRAWNVLTETEKLIFTSGVLAGVKSEAGDCGVSIEAAGMRYWPPRMEFDEHRKAVDQFFANPLNVGIPILEGFHIVSLEYLGASAAEVDRYVRVVRRLAAKDWDDPRNLKPAAAPPAQ